ncbi:MAG: D-aminoacylase [Chloroflexi bacterium]|nr:D-aminoacylase [Chloroflexota bacterium]
MFDLIIRGGSLIDGSGSPRRRSDVGVREGRVAALGDLSAAEAADTIDAAGRIVAPGFVDIHTHSDFTILSDPRARSSVRQGVTTEVIGNCGMSPAPLTDARAAEIRDALKGIDPDPAVRASWRSFAEYAAAVERARPAINVAPLIGHITLKVAAGGNEARPATTDERATMVRLLDESFEAGAVGLSTGLMFPPAMSADFDELVALGRAVARHGRLFAVHMRNYNDRLLGAVEEAIAVARATGCRLQVSHLAVAGRRNWGKVPQALALIDRARGEGLDIGTDIYPYVAGSANTSQILPEWAQAGGAPAIVERLGDEAERRRILEDWRSSRFIDWDEVEIVLVDPGMEELLGLTVEEIGRRRGIDPSLAVLDLIRDTENRAMSVGYGRSEDDLLAVLCHEATSIGSDGVAMDPDGPSGVGRPHPRSFGCYPRFLGRYVRDQGLVTLEGAIAMATSRPAERIGLADRGLVAEGRRADLVVVDPETVLDNATFAEPHRFPAGIEEVIVAGSRVIAAGEQRDDVRPGGVVRRAATIA